MITTPPPALPTVNSIVDRWIASAFDEIDDPDRGCRYFRADPTGRLRSIFGFDPSHRIPDGWVQARCGVEVPEHARIRGATVAPELHDVPGDTCGCGWRIFPGLTAATVAASVYPLSDGLRLDLPDIVLASVEFAGGLATPPVGRRHANDEAGTVRAEWLRVVGPIFIPPGMPSRARRGLAEHYPSAEVVELDEPPFDAVEAGDLPDVTAYPETNR